MRSRDAKKRQHLEAAGWHVGTAADFLKLTPEEATLVEMRVALSRSVKERRQTAGLTQTTLAKDLGSSQSRVAKLEAGDPSVSLDLLIRALLAVRANQGHWRKLHIRAKCQRDDFAGSARKARGD